MHVALESSGVPILAITSFLGMGDIVTKEAFDQAFSNPKIITASSVIGRLMDDMKSHKVCDQKILSCFTSQCEMSISYVFPTFYLPF